MKKYDLKQRLALANEGHALTITSYWVQDSWLLRIADQRGKRLGRAHALIPDQRATQEDFDLLNMMIRERDLLEKRPPSPELKPDPLDFDFSLNDPRLDGPSLDGLPDYAEEAEDPDVKKNPVLDESVFYNIPKAELMMSKQPRQPKPRQIKRDNHFPHYGAETILIRPGDPIPNIPAKHRKKGGPE
jgi:hypothetical protein